MKRQKWADICRGTGLQEVSREDWPAGIILVADAYFPNGHFKSPEGGTGIFMTMWAFGRDEDSLEVARPIWTPPWHKDGGLEVPTTREARCALALEDARQWMKDRHARAGATNH